MYGSENPLILIIFFILRVWEAKKESKAVRHNQAECRQYLEAGEAAETGQNNKKIIAQKGLFNFQ